MAKVNAIFIVTIVLMVMVMFKSTNARVLEDTDSMNPHVRVSKLPNTIYPRATSVSIDEEETQDAILYAFRPTNPGHSPGVGHLDESRDAHLYAFRPTAPGHSPRVGHPDEPQDAHLYAFRPTTPGHSPGVGHPILLNL
ncbi:hypothetical protein M5689_002111 [Euphorbia peplus]|nr:hypothetical protein M5689_002111 [Euphorbia peplus]